jgi:hypothetical protein
MARACTSKRSRSGALINAARFASTSGVSAQARRVTTEAGAVGRHSFAVHRRAALVPANVPFTSMPHFVEAR